MKKFGSTLLLISCMLFPHGLKASGFEHATSVRVNDHTLMFLLSYEMSHGTYDYFLPMKAVRDDKSNTALSYDVLTSNGLRTDNGKVYAAVLSHAPVKDGQYFVAHGKKERFTLVTFLILPEDQSTSSSAFSLRVNNLPFKLGTDGSYLQNQLTSGELAPYKTAVVDTAWQPK